MDEASAARIELTRIERGAVSRVEDFVAREEPLEIRVGGEAVVAGEEEAFQQGQARRLLKAPDDTLAPSIGSGVIDPAHHLALPVRGDRLIAGDLEFVVLPFGDRDLGDALRIEMHEHKSVAALPRSFQRGVIRRIGARHERLDRRNGTAAGDQRERGQGED